MSNGDVQETRPRATPRPRRWLRRMVVVPLVVALLVGVYYAVGGFWSHRIDVDPTFVATVPVPEAGLATVAAAAALLERETDRHGWVANDPWFLPGAMLHGMASFQTAIRNEVRRTVDDLAAAGTAVDADLETALGALAMPGDLWAFDLARSWRPQKTAEAFYRDAVAALRRFDARVATGSIADPMGAARDVLLGRIEASLGSAAAAALAEVEAQGGAWRPPVPASDLFLANAGSAYTQLVVLQALGRDRPEVGASAGFDAAVTALASAAGLQPRVITNGRIDSVVRPPHLAVQAALLARARDAVAGLRAGLPSADA